MQFRKINEEAKLPTRGSSEAAGYDLYSIEDIDLKPSQRALLGTGLGVNLPLFSAGLIWPRSKLANKHGLDVLAGVVDNDYTGEVFISVINLGQDTIEIRKGDKLAQMIVQKVSQTEPYWTNYVPETERGSKGITCSEMRLK